VLLVLGIAAVLPRLARARWRWYTGVAWVVVATALAAFSAFILIPISVAGAILFLHPAGDRKVRSVAVAAQAAAVLALFAAGQTSHDTDSHEDQWKNIWDAFVDFSWNPIRFVGNILTHIGRVGTVFPGGPHWIGALLVLVALAALIGIARTGRHAVRARYFIAVVVVAIVASVAQKFPFGASTDRGALGSGGRATLWLVPVVGFGLAVALQYVRGAISRNRRLAVGFDVVLGVAAVLIVVVALGRDTPRYPAGSEPATKFVASSIGPKDAVLIMPYGLYEFSTESGFDVSMKSAPQRIYSFVPVFADPRLHPIDRSISRKAVRDLVRDADRVFLHMANRRFDWPSPAIFGGLRDAGFDPEYEGNPFGRAGVMVFTRSPPVDSGSASSPSPPVDSGSAS
jgi:hypothetical protein